MDTFNMTRSSPILQTNPQISVLDVFFPGFTGILTLVQQLLAGNLNKSARFLCVCAALALSIKYVYRNLKEIMKAYFSLYVQP